MILVTVGTHFQPFDRLIKAADKYAATTAEKVIIQTGVSTYQCQHAEAFNVCPKDRMAQLQEEADIIVMQGGWGAMRESINKGKRIVAVPRIEGIEHIHDQIQIVKKLDSMGCLIGVYDIADLPEAIERAKTFKGQPLIIGDGAQTIADALKKLSK